MNSLQNKKRKVFLTCGSISYQDQIRAANNLVRKKGYILAPSEGKEELRLLCLYVVKNPLGSYLVTEKQSTCRMMRGELLR